MKYFIVSFLLFQVSYQCHAQKYMMLDMAISQSPFYSNKITVLEKYKGFFPVEKINIHKFVDVLEEISKRLSSKKITGKAKEYLVGCDKFTAHSVQIGSVERLDYVLTSTCDGIKITMHLCDSKLSNENNLYFVHTWISYITKAMRKKLKVDG